MVCILLRIHTYIYTIYTYIHRTQLIMTATVATVARPVQITAQYTLTDFDRIICNGFEYSVPQSIVDMVSKLADQVGAPTYIKTPVFPKGKNAAASSMLTGVGSGNGSANGGGGISASTMGGIGGASGDRRGSRRQDQQITDEDWETIRAFQATELVRVNGIETHINNVRASLNRLTTMNYDENRETILKEIGDLIRNNASDESLLKIGNSIFNTASSNQFYSALYARLFNDLLQHHSMFKTIFDANLSEFLGLFRSIEYCDPKKDYDKFCDMNKTNDRRKAMSLFIVNLMKQGIVAPDQVIELVLDLQKMIRDYLKTPGKTNELDEISENLFIIIKNSHQHLVSLEEWVNVLNSVTYISLLKIKSYPSITNKTIFKHIDILELFK